MTRAVEDGADVIDVSFGQRGGFANSPINLIASRISERGVPVIIAAGNQGTDGAFNAGDADSAEFALTAASVQSAALVGFPVEIAGIADLTEIFLLKPKTFTFPANQSHTLQLAFVEDACSPERVPDMRASQLAFVFRGACSSGDMKQNIFDKGGRYVIVSQNPPPNSTLYGEDINDEQQTADIASYDVAVKLRKALSGGGQVNVTFESTKPLEYRANKADGGLLTDFSNFGPTNDMRFDPHLGTPGLVDKSQIATLVKLTRLDHCRGNIFSTIPVALGSYSVVSVQRY